MRLFDNWSSRAWLQIYTLPWTSLKKNVHLNSDFMKRLQFLLFWSLLYMKAQNPRKFAKKAFCKSIFDDKYQVNLLIFLPRLCQSNQTRLEEPRTAIFIELYLLLCHTAFWLTVLCSLQQQQITCMSVLLGIISNSSFWL